MSERNDGGPTLRDLFAGLAMMGDWAAQNAHTGEISNKVSAEDLEGRAAVYYRQADAMLAAREGA
ncbi:hypothetical protein ABRZ04_04285 [Castellaniella ginsengisoli]|uniref:Uncharacterized protein n=1 Tax=Castellaniella ginsengisoli TaxID=546114 RepID=A0AB39D2Y6_9BURK